MSVAAEANSNPEATKFIARDIGNMCLTDRSGSHRISSADRLRMRIQYFANGNK